MITGIDHLVMTVADREKTRAFYCDGLGMRLVTFAPKQGGELCFALAFGDQKINLHDASHPHPPHALRPHPGGLDICFLTDFSLEYWLRHLAEQGIPIEEGPVNRSGATGPIQSLYLRDPDGNLVEIATKIS